MFTICRKIKGERREWAVGGGGRENGKVKRKKKEMKKGGIKERREGERRREGRRKEGRGEKQSKIFKMCCKLEILTKEVILIKGRN